MKESDRDVACPLFGWLVRDKRFPNRLKINKRNKRCRLSLTNLNLTNLNLINLNLTNLNPLPHDFIVWHFTLSITT